MGFFEWFWTTFLFVSAAWVLLVVIALIDGRYSGDRAERLREK